jgi:phospholipid transport system substrate-binding protein
MRYIFSAIICVFLCAAPIRADETGEVLELLKTRIDTVVLLLHDKTGDKASRDERIIEIVSPIFDYQTMAKLSLGKKYWPTLSPQQQATFSELFIKRLQESYLDKLNIYSNEEILYGEPQTEGKMVHVSTTLISGDSRIGMFYKFYRSPQGWKIYDVEIGGVSVIQTYRSQFDGVLSEGSIDDLLEKLKTRGAFAVAEPGKEGALSK